MLVVSLVILTLNNSEKTNCREIALCDFYLSFVLFLFGFVDFRHVDCQHTIVDFCRDVVFHNIVGQHKGLLVIGVAELAANVVFFLVFLFVLKFVLDCHFEVAVIVDVDTAELLLDAGSGHFHCVGLVIFFDVDSGFGAFHFRHPLVVDELIKHGWEPTDER